MKKQLQNAIPYQEETNQRLDMQIQKAGTCRVSNLLLIIVLVSAMFLFGTLLMALPQQTFSEQENRTLKTFPEITRKTPGDKLIDGSFFSEFTLFCEDQFPFRNAFVAVKSVFELSQGKAENNGILYGKDGYLIARMQNTGKEYLPVNLESVSSFASRITTDGIPVTLAVAGRTADIMKEKTPLFYPTEEADAPWELLEDELSQTEPSFGFVDLRPALIEAAGQGVQVMYRTDHHWTTEGAYEAYCALLRSWNMDPLPKEYFTQEIVSDSFYGTSYRSSGFRWVAPDTITFWRFPGDEDIQMFIGGVDGAFSGFYDRSYLEKTDKYSAFLSGNNGYTQISLKEESPREKLLLIKDSFAHCLVPFLACHFDLEIVDLRYYKQSVAALARDAGCSRILILYNMASLTDSPVLGLLGME
ncbi:MAG: hypothetical protein II719_05475 [Clostridia bacterium]|nr:hypothetical protein [Clostridia bacterium]